MLDALDGTRLGHLGIGFIDWEGGYGEADAIVSGGASPPGLMKAALQTLLRWAETQLGLRRLAVRVRSDNPAVAFYARTGFREWQRVPIAAVVSAEGHGVARGARRRRPRAESCLHALRGRLMEIARIGRDGLTRYVLRQLDLVAPDGRDASTLVAAHLDTALGRLRHCIAGVRAWPQERFDYLHSTQHCLFLYYLANSIWRATGETEVTDQAVPAQQGAERHRLLLRDPASGGAVHRPFRRHRPRQGHLRRAARAVPELDGRQEPRRRAGDRRRRRDVREHGRHRPLPAWAPGPSSRRARASSTGTRRTAASPSLRAVASWRSSPFAVRCLDDIFRG